MPDATYPLTRLSAPIALGAVTTNEGGSATYRLKLPTDLEAGTHTVVVTDARGTTRLSYAFKIFKIAARPTIIRTLSKTGRTSQT